jgi:predicted PurR-regulated permease PerM
MVLVLVVLIPRLVEQSLAFIERLPYYVSDALVSLRPWVEEKLNMRLSLDPMQIQRELTEYTQDLVGDWASVVETAATSVFAIAVALGNLLLIPLFTVYLLKDFPYLREAVIEFVPPRHRARLSGVVGQVNRVMGSYVRGTLIVVLVLAVIYSVALSIMGIPFAILIGIAGAVLNVIPYLGPILGMLLTLLMALLEGMSLGTMLGVAILFAVVPIIDSTIISPNIVGDRVGLPPIAVIVAILSFGQLFGVVGILLAVPVTAVLKVIVLELVRSYHESEFYRRT